MMIDRIEGNAELKKSVRMMLDSRRMTHSPHSCFCLI